MAVRARLVRFHSTLESEIAYPFLCPGQVRLPEDLHVRKDHLSITTRYKVSLNASVAALIALTLPVFAVSNDGENGASRPISPGRRICRGLLVFVVKRLAETKPEHF